MEEKNKNKGKVRLIHFSDVHLGLEVHGRKDPQRGLHDQVRDFVACLDHLVRVALEERVDLVLCAGDAFEHTRPFPSVLRSFLEKVHKLAQEGIPIVLTAGNHDMPASRGEGSPLDIAPMIDPMRIHFKRAAGWVAVDTASGPVSVLCIPYASTLHLLRTEEMSGRSDDQVSTMASERLMSIIERQAHQPPERPGPRLLLAHLWVEEGSLSGTEKWVSTVRDPRISIRTLSRLNFSYGALGHLHKHQRLGDDAHPFVYCGSLGRIDFSEEKDEKGFCLVELRRKGEVWSTDRIDFIPTPTRRFFTLTLDISQESHPTQAILNFIDRRDDIRGAVVRLLIKIQESQKGLVNIPAVRAALQKKVEFIAFIRQETVGERIEPPVVSLPPESDWQHPVKLLAWWLEEKSGEKVTEVQKSRLLRRAQSLWTEVQKNDGGGV